MSKESKKKCTVNNCTGTMIIITTQYFDQITKTTKEIKHWICDKCGNRELLV